MKTTVTVAAGGILAPYAGIKAAELPFVKATSGYELLFMATSWGYNGSTADFCALAKKEGYEGIEVWWPGEDLEAQKELFDALKKYNLQVGFLCGAGEHDSNQHLSSFMKNVAAVLGNSFQKPLYINCHSGKDYFTYEENKKIIDFTVKKAKSSGIPIYHETHRGRMLYTAPISRNFIEKNPELRITLDISHWCVVHESLLGNQKETIKMVLDRVDHIHSRVGHPEGPQVSDPRAPEWADALNAHLAWWDQVIERKKSKGERMTILTEFGPPDYMPTLPYTRQPVADQWAINVFMMNLLRKRYQ